MKDLDIDLLVCRIMRKILFNTDEKHGLTLLFYFFSLCALWLNLVRI